MTRHIVFCVNNEYSCYVRVPIKSIAEIHKEDRKNKYVIHILSDFISNKNLKLLSNEFYSYSNIDVIIHKVNDVKLRDLYTRTWPIQTWYRILIPEILPQYIDKVLYLDTDTLLLSNLNGLFETDMTGKSIAATIDYQTIFDYPFERCKYNSELGYICSGVMLMNLNYWRHYNITERIIDWAHRNENRLKCPDQDAINFICKDNKIVLPMQYGIMDCFLTNPIFKKEGYTEQIKDCLENPIIVHYNGCPPWYKEYEKHSFHHQWERFNSILKKPVKPHYQAEGFLLLKIIATRILKKIDTTLCQKFL